MKPDDILYRSFPGNALLVSARQNTFSYFTAAALEKEYTF